MRLDNYLIQHIRLTAYNLLYEILFNAHVFRSFFCFLLQGELCTLGSRPGMECLPLRSPPGAYHYHVTDQTKSLQVRFGVKGFS